ncbi:MAG TPA: type III pantothenate kinase [Acidimicrobiales bacterium]|nr:type III pantothenate kinase [Acidimicrobiales bacterium]
MLLAIDVGNTQILLALYDGNTFFEHWRLATHADRTSDEYAVLVRQFIGATEVSGVAISSVVPRATSALRSMATRYFGIDPVVVEPGTKTGMPILIDNPREVGADRVVNAIGAYDLYGGPAVVVDFGTATTLDAVSAKGEYLGGAILPGIEISMDALFQRADRLSRVELVEPRSVIGKSTAEALQSGAIYGFAGQVDAIVARMEDELGEASVVATGGLAPLIARFSTTIEHLDPWLTLHGLRIVFERNAGAVEARGR